jgi:hypothetical protein
MVFVACPLPVPDVNVIWRLLYASSELLAVLASFACVASFPDAWRFPEMSVAVKFPLHPARLLIPVYEVMTLVCPTPGPETKLKVKPL